MICKILTQIRKEDSSKSFLLPGFFPTTPLLNSPKDPPKNHEIVHHRQVKFRFHKSEQPEVNFRILFCRNAKFLAI